MGCRKGLVGWIDKDLPSEQVNKPFRCVLGSYRVIPISGVSFLEWEKKDGRIRGRVTRCLFNS